MKMRWWLALGLLSATCLPVGAQQEERLWMPEGYRLLSLEQRQGLAPDELKAISSRNQTLLEEALARMTPAERVALGGDLEQFGRTHALSDVEKHYVTLVSTRLLSGAMQEHVQQEAEAEKARFQKLLRDQEETTRGFPSDQKSVEAEAWATYERRGKEDPQALYLRVLKPLRARPWNDVTRFVFQKLVGPGQPFVEINGEKHPLPPGLPDAALAFCKKRQAETPSEGSWFSLEAFLRLRRGEVGEAKRLFRIAIAKDAKDGDSYVFPLLIAEIDQDAPEVARLRARAQRVWPKPNDLDRALLLNVVVLPAEMEAKARRTFESRYKQAYPADWESRVAILRKNLEAGEFHGVESETGALLALPLSVLPEPQRTDLGALNLQAQAALGQCAGLESQIPLLEVKAASVYPRESDPDSPPPVRASADVRAFRAELEDRRKTIEKLKRSTEDGSIDASADWGEVPAAQRRSAAQRLVEKFEAENAATATRLPEGDDAAAALEWSRRELEKWEEEHFPGLWRASGGHLGGLDIYGHAEGLSIDVRSAIGRCLLAKGDARAAVRVLKPCIAGRYYHGACITPLVEAGVALVRVGALTEALAIYKLVSPSVVSTDPLFDAIKAAAPGAVERRTIVSRPPLVLEDP